MSRTTTEERAALLAICDNAVGPFSLELGKTIAALLADLAESEERADAATSALADAHSVRYVALEERIGEPIVVLRLSPTS